MSIKVGCALLLYHSPIRVTKPHPLDIDYMDCCSSRLTAQSGASVVRFSGRERIDLDFGTIIEVYTSMTVPRFTEVQ